ncbi:MAG TPA: N,N-dimethylformamidase beta subunit family domain-containing protein [Candidatus Baltobacteraceae bacterium]|nr:N,N-dimethylformamidase beta subunit family domain-containing protein [Candidatus Baltobacteraceae bacterium]
MIRAYPGRASVCAGDTLALHVSSPCAAAAQIYRCGRRLEAIGALACEVSGNAAEPGSAGSPWNWPRYGIQIPAHAQPGAYIAAFKTTMSADAREGCALFVIRPRVARAPLLVILPIFTYHAYNVAHVNGTLGKDEGECLYSGAPWVTLARPGGGTGGHPWDEVNVDVYDRSSPRQTFAHWDGKALAWLERHGFAYECCTDLDVHDGTVKLSDYRAIASFGHHEYWTKQMRARVQAFIASGGNLAFFGGNTCWFEAEYDAGRDAVRRVGRWTKNPEWLFTGVSYACGGGKWIGARDPAGYRVSEPSHWIFDGLRASRGDIFGAQERLIGYECDGAPPQSDVRVLAQASIAGWNVRDGSGEISRQARASLGVRGAKENIFTASTVDWARLLHYEERYVSRITRNVLNRFLNIGERPEQRTAASVR